MPIYYDGTKNVTDRPTDLVTARNMIRPGSVLWFSHSKPKKAGGLNALFSTGPGKINHMSTVVAVNRDAAGNLLSFSMYHGRNKRKPAAITKHQYWDWPSKFTKKGKRYPSLGYWGQYLVGLGTIMPVAADYSKP